MVGISGGGAALAPQVGEGWRTPTHNFEVEQLHTHIADGLRAQNDSRFAASNGGAACSFLAERLIAGDGLDNTELRLVAGAPVRSVWMEPV